MGGGLDTGCILQALIINKYVKSTHAYGDVMWETMDWLCDGSNRTRYIHEEGRGEEGNRR